MLAQAASDAPSFWSVAVASVTTAGVVITALIANRARITANKVEQQVTPNSGASAHDAVMGELRELRKDVRGRFAAVDERINGHDDQLKAMHESHGRMAKWVREHDHPELSGLRDVETE